MQTIFELKEQTVTETPLLLFDCQLADGFTEHWSTHSVAASGASYDARVLRHTAFEIQTASDQGVDGIPRVTLLLANADSHFSQLERSHGLKGARLTVRFVFFDLQAGEPASEATVVFQGICNPPDEIREDTFRMSATNRMSMQRVLLPQVRIQRRCPWNFPVTTEQRAEALDGGSEGKYSRFYRCGYSPDVGGGSGSLDTEGPFTTCTYSKEDCRARGLLSHFGGIEFVPSSISVRTYGEKGSHASPVQENAAKYNDFVPMVYGTAWIQPPIVLARNDGNLSRLEVLLGIGEVQGVLRVLVNDVEIPPGQTGANMTGTGWYNVPTLGTRAGGYNLDFTNADGTPSGDPYGSMAYIAVVVPNRINDGSALPRVSVLLQGLKLPCYAVDGSYLGEEFSNNPAWVLLDVLRRSGWSIEELDIPSFSNAAAYCSEEVNTADPNGNPISIPRFQCNLVIRKRRSAGDVIRGIRNGARLFLTYNDEGAVRVSVENAIAVQQPAKPEGSNATDGVNGGWPAYEFGDGTRGVSGILRRDDGSASVRVWSRSSADTGNRMSVEFQDEFNEYQQDSLSLADADDIAKVGQEITAPISVLGIPNYDQAARVLKFNLDKSLQGNLYIEFETSVRALGLKPGDLITVTYLKEGFDRALFRALKIAPGSNYATAVITAQIHRDDWYSDGSGGVSSVAGAGREGGTALGVPRPIGGSARDEAGQLEYRIREESTDGSPSVDLSVEFSAPPSPSSSGPRPPLLDLAPVIQQGGSLAGGQTLYYGITALGQDGVEGPLSFLARVRLGDSNGYSVGVTGLSFTKTTTGFNVYRGPSPAQLYQIASNVAVRSDYLDSGEANGFVPAPDSNFDHVNFYWRFELVPETQASVHSATSIGNGSLEMGNNQYRGATVRITNGRGAGQERVVTANSATSATVAPSWEVVPDTTSRFVIAESAWKFGAMTSSSPAGFQVPNRPGETIQVCGRAANVNDNECALELSVVTRWMINGAGADTGVPAAPVFGVGASQRGGNLEISGVAFEDLVNTRSIVAGTLTLRYWNELSGQPGCGLGSAMAAEDTQLSLTGGVNAQTDAIFQVDGELMRVQQVNAPAQYQVTRGVLGTAPAAHESGALVYQLETTTAVMPFPKDFFGSPYCGNWSYSITLPDVRVAAAELFLTNANGDGDPGVLALTQLEDYGLRTLSGGQYSIQVEGFLAVQDSAAPPLVVDAPHAVRDIFAVLGRAADGPVQVQVNLDGTPLGTVTVPAGLTVSNSLRGFGLPLLTAGACVSAAILSVGQTYPGADLTVVIRL